MPVIFLLDLFTITSKLTMPFMKCSRAWTSETVLVKVRKNHTGIMVCRLTNGVLYISGSHRPGLHE